jgi:hypothetical protein
MGGSGRKGSGSFLKKRTKKLLSLGYVLPASPRQNRKRFLLLFFKKEGLSHVP